MKLKSDILDAPGRVVAERLVDMGFSEVKDVRIGKIIELELEAVDREAIEERVAQMCEKLLSSAVVEDYAIQSIT